MIRWLSILSVISILLISCSHSTTAKPPIANPNSQNVPLITNAGQKLPISAQAIFPKNQIIQLEVARTPNEQMMGLMYRPALPDNRGMLFQFSSPESIGFWMKNVPVPLDMVFIRNQVIVGIEKSVPPCNAEPCPVYGPKKAFDQVIELRSGRATELNLKIGDRVKIEFFNSGSLRRQPSR
jgi:hypothetical protein